MMMFANTPSVVTSNEYRIVFYIDLYYSRITNLGEYTILTLPPPTTHNTL